MHISIAIVFTALVASAKASSDESDVFSITILNAAIDTCGPETCVNTCSCGINNVEWTSCIDILCNLTIGRPSIGACLNMAEIEDICDLYTDPNEVRTCPTDSD